MTLLVALAVGVAIGLTLGALGGGGSILTVPALVFLLGESAQNATTASLVIVGVSSAIGAISYARDHHVRWGAGLTFGAAGLASTWVGSTLNRSVPQDTLLLAFAALMVVSGIGMLLKSRTQPAQAVRPRQLAAVGGGTAAADPSTDNDRDDPKPRLRAVPARWEHRRSIAVAQLVVAGLAVGFLTGFLGVGGGFLIVPVLTMLLGYRMCVAVGTSLLIITINSTAALLARVGHQHFDWAVIIPVTAAAIVGSLAGKRVADRLPQTVLTRIFARLVLAVSAYMILTAL